MRTIKKIDLQRPDNFDVGIQSTYILQCRSKRNTLVGGGKGKEEGGQTGDALIKWWAVGG